MSCFTLQSWFHCPPNPPAPPLRLQEITHLLFNLRKFLKTEKYRAESCKIHWNLLSDIGFGTLNVLKLKYRGRPNDLVVLKNWSIGFPPRNSVSTGCNGVFSPNCSKTISSPKPRTRPFLQIFKLLPSIPGMFCLSL